MVRAKAVSMLHASQDAFRAAQLMQLEDIARRASQGMDIKSEIAARKLIASVSGVTRSEPDDAMRDFLAVVRSVSAKRERLGEARRPALPPALEPEPLDPEPEDDEDDREALGAYDREN